MASEEKKTCVQPEETPVGRETAPPVGDDGLRKPMQFRIAGNDNSGEIVKRIYVQRPEYVIYRTIDAIYVEYDHSMPGIDSYYERNAKLLRHVSKVTSYLPNNLGECEQITSQVARAVATNLRGLEEVAIKILDEAEQRVLRTRAVQGRLQYTLSSLCVVCCVLLLRYFFFNAWPDSDTAGNYLDIACCGAMGGFLSVATGFKRIDIDIDADKLTNCLVGCSRILISIVGSIFVFFVVKSGIVLGFVNNEGNSFALFAIAIASGFSERFVPNLMDDLVQRRGGTEQSSDAK